MRSALRAFCGCLVVFLAGLKPATGQTIGVIRFGFVESPAMKVCEEALARTVPSPWTVEAKPFASRDVLDRELFLANVQAAILSTDSFREHRPLDGPLGVLSRPFLFRNLEHVSLFLRSDVYRQMAETYRYKNSAVPVAGAYFGTRHVLTRVGAAKPEDVAGTRDWAWATNAARSFFDGSVPFVELPPVAIEREMLTGLAPQASRHQVALTSAVVDFAHFSVAVGWFPTIGEPNQEKVKVWFSEAAQQCSSARLSQDRRSLSAIETAGVKVVDVDVAALRAGKPGPPTGSIAAPWVPRIEALR